jgi:hypothetical protein
VGAGWLASSLPVSGENLFRAEKPSIFRRKEQYDELDESSILNPGNLSSHDESGSPAPSPQASASFLGLGRQSNSNTPISGGLGSLIGKILYRGCCAAKGCVLNSWGLSCRCSWAKLRTCQIGISQVVWKLGNSFVLGQGSYCHVCWVWGYQGVIVGIAP